jgi:hypothetical protein
MIFKIHLVRRFRLPIQLESCESVFIASGFLALQSHPLFLLIESRHEANCGGTRRLFLKIIDALSGSHFALRTGYRVTNSNDLHIVHNTILTAAHYKRWLQGDKD